MIAAIRDSRGAQLRALVLSWYSNDTYQRALQEQAEALRSGELEISPDWADIAEQILEPFTVQRNTQIIKPGDSNVETV